MKHDRQSVQQPRDFPSPWARSERPVVRRVVRPLERFVSREAGSGAILVAAALVALVWANLAPQTYDDFWHLETAVGVGGAELHLDLREIVNDLLMVVFFYVVALEVKRAWPSADGLPRGPRYTAVTRAEAVSGWPDSASTCRSLLARLGDTERR